MKRIALFLPFLCLVWLAPPSSGGQGPPGRDPVGAERAGVVELDRGFGPDPYSLRMDAGGGLEGEAVGCAVPAGYFPEGPGLWVYYFGGGVDAPPNLYIWAEGDDDLTLAVAPLFADTLCDDDGLTGTDPLIVLPTVASPEVNVFSVSVGTYGGGRASSTLFISENDPRDAVVEVAPDPALGAADGDVVLVEGFGPDPYVVADLVAGGNLAVSRGLCTFGHVPDAPHLKLRYEGGGSSPLYLFAESAEDTVLLVQQEGGSWSCDDDGYEGVDPLLVLPEPGHYVIWLGTFDRLGSGGRSTLYISAADPR
jgi:hypothetical protein